MFFQNTELSTNKVTKISLACLFGVFLIVYIGHSMAHDSASKKSVDSVTHYQILIHNFSFEPKKLVVNRGDRVTWINKDFVPHNITAEIGVDGKDEPKMEKYSSDLRAEEKFTMTVNNDFDYLCGLHPSMKGKILVK